jgi:hypothetical protein
MKVHQGDRVSIERLHLIEQLRESPAERTLQVVTVRLVVALNIDLVSSLVCPVTQPNSFRA